MTLIAAMHPRGCLTLITDVLVVSPMAPARDIPLPTMVYIPPERRRNFLRHPVTFYRKVVELTQTEMLLWSGDVNAAHEFASLARECSQEGVATEQALNSLRMRIENPRPDFGAIFATTGELGAVGLGNVYKSRSTFAGSYGVAGTGRRIFCELMDQMSPNEAGEVAPDVDGLRVVGDLMAREIYTLQPLAEQFGASYEILFRGPSGFERLDDVMHMFVWVGAAANESKLSYTLYAHPIRQWYEGDQLYVFSYSGHETTAQGLKSGLFMIPSILGKATEPTRDLTTLNYEPRYLSVHHLIEVDGRRTLHTLNLSGEAIRKEFSFLYDGTNFNIDPTEHYYERVRQRVARLRAKGA